MSMEEAKRTFDKACETGNETDMQVFQDALDKALNQAASDRYAKAVSEFNFRATSGRGLVGQEIEIEGERFVLEVRRVS